MGRVGGCFFSLGGEGTAVGDGGGVRGGGGGEGGRGELCMRKRGGRDGGRRGARCRGRGQDGGGGGHAPMRLACLARHRPPRATRQLHPARRTTRCLSLRMGPAMPVDLVSCTCHGPYHTRSIVSFTSCSCLPRAYPFARAPALALGPPTTHPSCCCCCRRSSERVRGHLQGTPGLRPQWASREEGCCARRSVGAGGRQRGGLDSGGRGRDMGWRGCMRVHARLRCLCIALPAVLDLPSPRPVPQPPNSPTR